jgi:hypothetical protein
MTVREARPSFTTEIKEKGPGFLNRGLCSREPSAVSHRLVMAMSSAYSIDLF